MGNHGKSKEESEEESEEKSEEESEEESQEESKEWTLLYLALLVLLRAGLTFAVLLRASSPSAWQSLS